jgi:hypothetical protein
VRQENASNTSGTVLARRPPNRMASIGTPAGSSHSGAITGHWEAGTVKRALGCAAPSPDRRGPLAALPVDALGGLGTVHVLPPHVAVRLSTQLVKMVSG